MLENEAAVALTYLSTFIGSKSKFETTLTVSAFNLAIPNGCTLLLMLDILDVYTSKDLTCSEGLCQIRTRKIIMLFSPNSHNQVRKLSITHSIHM